jgi:hypothetical protein
MVRRGGLSRNGLSTSDADAFAIGQLSTLQMRNKSATLIDSAAPELQGAMQV